MHGARATTVDSGIAKGSWSEIFRNGLGLYSALVIGGIAMHATQMLVIAIIMPTIVADIGGASFYTWAAMLYTIGAIVGASSTGVVWGRLGARRGYALGAGVFALGTAACALAPDIGVLIAARTVQGWAGGLVAGSGMALITALFDARLRTRIIALWWGFWFRVTIQVTSNVETFSILALTMYGVWVTPDWHARTLLFDPSRAVAAGHACRTVRARVVDY